MLDASTTASIRNSKIRLKAGCSTCAVTVDPGRDSELVISYAARANRIVIKHRLGNVVAVIEIVSPGNKSSRHALRSLVGNAVDLIRRGIHLLVVDLFPPSLRDPEGIHQASIPTAGNKNWKSIRTN